MISYFVELSIWHLNRIKIRWYGLGGARSREEGWQRKVQASVADDHAANNDYRTKRKQNDTRLTEALLKTFQQRNNRVPLGNPFIPLNNEQ